MIAISSGCFLGHFKLDVVIHEAGVNDGAGLREDEVGCTADLIVEFILVFFVQLKDWLWNQSSCFLQA